MWDIPTSGPYPLLSHQPSTWLQLDQNKQPVSSPAEQNDGFRKKKMTNDEVREKGVVEPPTYYFPNPKEMFTEPLTLFRYDIGSRGRLLREHPEIYQMVKTEDQREIDRFYGKDNQGNSTHVRIPEGFVVARTPNADRLIDRFEKAMSK